jgi:hypothetical protein
MGQSTQKICRFSYSVLSPDDVSPHRVFSLGLPSRRAGRRRPFPNLSFSFPHFRLAQTTASLRQVRLGAKATNRLSESDPIHAGLAGLAQVPVHARVREKRYRATLTSASYL